MLTWVYDNSKLKKEFRLLIRTTSHPLGWLESKRRQTITSAGEEVKKLEPSYLDGGSVQ